MEVWSSSQWLFMVKADQWIVIRGNRHKNGLWAMRLLFREGHTQQVCHWKVVIFMVMKDSFRVLFYFIEVD